MGALDLTALGVGAIIGTGIFVVIGEEPAFALEEGAGLTWAATVTSFGALVAITSVMLTTLYGQTRIMFAMSRDGLIPEQLAQVSPAPAPRSG